MNPECGESLFQINSSSKNVLEPLPASANGTVTTKTRKQPVRTISNVEVEIDANTFEGGKARLQCVGNLFNLYTRKVETVFDEDRPKPRPSSVMGSRDSASGEMENAKVAKKIYTEI